jgi:hypothetical protein
MALTQVSARHLVLSRRGGVLAAVTGLLGAGTAWVVARSGSAFVDVLEPVQLAVSVLVPFFGVRAVTDLHRSGTPVDRRLSRRLLSAVGVAVGFAVAGTLLTAAATAFADRSWPSPARVAALVAGAVLVQVIAQLTGTGWGLLLARPAVAMAATIVVPMGSTVLLSVIDPGGGLVRWLTPYGNAHSLLTGEPTPSVLAAFCVVVLLWCLVPNLLGIHRLDHAAPS